MRRGDSPDLISRLRSLWTDGIIDKGEVRILKARVIYKEPDRNKLAIRREDRRWV